MTLTMIVFDKVGSPQYMTWLAAPIAAALGLGLPGWRNTARWALVVAGVTQVVFPWLYPAITRGDVSGTVVLAARNVLLVVLLVWTVRALALGGSARAETGVDGAAQEERRERVPVAAGFTLASPRARSVRCRRWRRRTTEVSAMQPWPTITLGATGEDVRTVQYLLDTHGHAVAVDAQYGPITQGAPCRRSRATPG